MNKPTSKPGNKPAGKMADKPRRSFKRIIVGSLAVIIGLTVLCGGVYAWWLRTPPPMPTTIDESIALLKSPRFNRLTDDQKEPYVEQSMKLRESLSEEDRRSLMEKFRGDPELRRAAGEAGMNEMALRAREFALADPTKKVQILDQAIAMMEMFRRGGPTTRPDGGAGGGPGGGDRPPMSDADRAKWQQERQNQFQSRRQQRIEHGNPQKQAYMAEFMKALRARRQQLGLPAGGPGGPGGQRRG
ncbi:MAG: hypothetical protein K8S99_08740 [Planctomycetes bacterium]|nr:hypothetical protein [Planctomycetota bacterium]